MNLKYAIPILLMLAVSPAFAQTVNCPNGCTVTVTPNPQTYTISPAGSSGGSSPLPYYKNPDPATSAFTDIVNTFFNKLGQSAVQMSGGSSSQYGMQVQNVTSGVQQVVDTSIDYLFAVKYLVASLLALIVPKVFGFALPPWVFPVSEVILIGLMIYALLHKGWKLFLTALAIGIGLVLLIYVGGVVFH